ncbi:hypothetical protein HDV00_003686 [Rhizophlyctis rosea]|nr:hypothetical protein HDV00_003686 [Rhizophlyctis rosea]
MTSRAVDATPIPRLTGGHFALSIPELFLNVLRSFSNKELFNIRLVSKYFQKYAREAYNDRRKTFLRLTIVTEDHLIKSNKSQTAATIQRALNSLQATPLPKGYGCTTILLQCVDHLSTDNPHGVLQLRSISTSEQSPTFPFDRIAALHITPIAAIDSANPPAQPELTHPLPGTHPIFRDTRDLPLRYDYGALYGSDFILAFAKHTSRVEHLFLADTLVGPAHPLPHRRMSIYPRKPWEVFLQSAQDNGLELLVPALQKKLQKPWVERESPLGSRAPAIRCWLWVGKNGRSQLRELVRDIVGGAKEKLSDLLNSKVETANKQLQSYALMKMDTLRHRQVIINLRKRLMTELFNDISARNILQLEQVPMNPEDDNRDLLQVLDDFQKTQLPKFDQSRTMELLYRVLGSMFEEGEKEMWWLEGRGVDRERAYTEETEFRSETALNDSDFHIPDFDDPM